MGTVGEDAPRLSRDEARDMARSIAKQLSSDKTALLDAEKEWRERNWGQIDATEETQAQWLEKWRKESRAASEPIFLELFERYTKDASYYPPLKILAYASEYLRRFGERSDLALSEDEDDWGL